MCVVSNVLYITWYVLLSKELNMLNHFHNFLYKVAYTFFEVLMNN